MATLLAFLCLQTLFEPESMYEHFIDKYLFKFIKMETRGNLTGIDLTKVSMGQWQLYLPREPDLEVDGQPFVSLTMIYHPQTHDYVWRVLGRLVESGRVNSFQQFLGKCHQLFRSGTPCLGMKPPDIKFPLSCQFSDKCSIMVPKFKEAKSCQACLESSEDPVELWHDIQDVLMDIIYNNGEEAFEDSLKDSWPCPVCSIEVEVNEMKTHLEQSHLISNFVCLDCNAQFVTAKDLSFHAKEEHPEIQELLCPLCVTNIPWNESREIDVLSNHFQQCLHNKKSKVKTSSTVSKKNHPSFAFCSVCQKELEVEYLSRHLMFHHCIGDFKCNSCPGIFQKAEELMDHVFDTHPSQTCQVCPNCVKEVDIWDKRRTLVDHMKTCHKIIFLNDMKGERVPMGGTICSDCGKIFRFKIDLAFHESHECNQVIQSRKKKMGTKSSNPSKKSALFLKEYQASVPKTFSCVYCSRKYQERRNLMKHLRNVCAGQLQKNDADSINLNPNPFNSDDVGEFLDNAVDLKLESLDIIDDMEQYRDNASPRKIPTSNSTSDLKPNPENEGVPVEPPKSSSDMAECHICFRKHDANTWLKHLMFRHQMGKFDCPKCSLKFVTAEQISKHLVEHPEVSELQCPNCKQDIGLEPDLKGLENHMVTCHKLKFRWDEATQKHVQYTGRTCMDCEQRFDTPKQLIEHESNDICGIGPNASQRRIKYVKQLLQRRKKKQPDETNSSPVTCEICAETFLDMEKFKYHQNTRHFFSPVLCDTCGKELLNETRLRHHIRRYHPTSDELLCKECGFRGISNSNLKKHQSIHKPPKIICPICGKKFNRQEYLKRHTRTHTGEKPFKCNLLHITAYNSNFSTHKKSVHNIELKGRTSRRKKPVTENLLLEQDQNESSI